MRAFQKAVWLVFSAMFLVSCGGGGGDAGDARPVTLAISPTTLTANFQTGTSATLTGQITVGDAAAYVGEVHAVVVDSKQVLSGGVEILRTGATGLSFTLHTLASLPEGRHQGTFEVRLCKDVACTAQFPGSPLIVPYDLSAATQPLVVVPSNATAATVYLSDASSQVSAVSVTAGEMGWAATSDASWLLVDNGTGKGNASFNVRFSPQAEAIGSHAGKVTVKSSDGQTVDVPFSLTVLPLKFVLAAGVPSFSAINGTDIPSQTLSFELGNKAAFPWTFTSSAPWLKAIAQGSVTPAKLTVQPDPAASALASGVHSADLVLSSPGAQSKTVTTQLTLIQPTLSSTVTSLTFGGPKGRELGVQSLPLFLNTGTRSWPWTLSALPAWASTATPNGTVNQAGTSIGLSANVTQTPAGSTSGLATVTATINGDVVTLPITLNRNADQRRLLVSEAGVAFAVVADVSNLTRTLTVKDNFGGALAWSATSDSPWLSVTSSGSTGGASQIVLTANPASLLDDSLSYATVTIKSAVAGVQPAVVRVGLAKERQGLAFPGMAELFNLTTIHTQPVPYHPVPYVSIVADKIRPYIYANNGGSFVDIFNPHDIAKHVGTIVAAGVALGQMSVSPDGSRLYALDTAARTMVVIDLATRARVGSWPLDQAVDANTAVLAVRTNGVDLVLLGDGTAYTATGRSLGMTGIWGTVLSATSDGTQVQTTGGGAAPAFDIDYSEISGGILMVSPKTPPANSPTAWGPDVAISRTGSALYLASGESPGVCKVIDPVDRSLKAHLNVGSGFMATNVEVTHDGRVVCATARGFSLFAPNGTLLRSYSVDIPEPNILPQQLVVTPDGMYVFAASDKDYLLFWQIGRQQ